MARLYKYSIIGKGSSIEEAKEQIRRQREIIDSRFNPPRLVNRIFEVTLEYKEEPGIFGQRMKRNSGDPMQNLRTCGYDITFLAESSKNWGKAIKNLRRRKGCPFPDCSLTYQLEYVFMLSKRKIASLGKEQRQSA